MMHACSACRRPVPLTVDEIAILSGAARSPAGMPAADLSADALRALIRMGYLVKVANDDGGRSPRAMITERGRAWLSANLRP
ncbi:MAG TPA: hypothetical protein VLL76_09155 [Candidatus Omnitrophota bacterium]|nr:hypothetical protein [Candidatus Omnitrophota bacterium]